MEAQSILDATYLVTIILMGLFLAVLIRDNLRLRRRWLSVDKCCRDQCSERPSDWTNEATPPMGEPAVRDEDVAYLTADCAMTQALAKVEAAHQAKLAAMAPDHNKRVEVARQIVAVGQEWLRKNEVQGCFAVKEFLGGAAPGSMVKVVFTTEDKRCTTEIHVAAPGKDYMSMIESAATSLLQARELHRQFPGPR